MKDCSLCEGFEQEWDAVDMPDLCHEQIIDPGEREEALLRGQGQRSSVTGGVGSAVLRSSAYPSNCDQGFMK